MNYMPHPTDLARTLDLVTTDFVFARLIGDRRRWSKAGRVTGFGR
jgi:hypothetical protein